MCHATEGHADILCADLEELGVARLALAEAVALPVLAGHRHEEERDGNVLQLEPVEQRQRGGCAGPVQQFAQLVQKRDRLEYVECHRAKIIHVPREYERVPAPAAPAPQEKNPFYGHCNKCLRP